MSATSFQTVALRRGKHSSPENGACVMELASMLAGEAFTDRPRCASPVIAALLRSYNDCCSDRRRQDLYGCAARVVGTRAALDVERARITHTLSVLLEFDAGRSRRLRLLRSPTVRHARDLVAADELRAEALEDFMWCVARMLRSGGERGHERLLALVEELAAIDVRLPGGGVQAPLARYGPAATLST